MPLRSALIICALFVVLIAGLRTVPDTRTNIANALGPPSASHWMGTDELGRDVYRRTAHALAISVLFASSTWLVAIAIGIAFGAYAGYSGGATANSGLRWGVALIYATPFLVVLAGILALVGPGALNTHAVILLFAWAPPARYAFLLSREVRLKPFVLAAESIGYSKMQVLRHMILPQINHSVITASLPLLPEIMAIDAALSFLGLGLPPPTPTLGGLIVAGANYASIAWWMAAFPLASVVVVCGLLRLARRGRTP